MPQTETGPFPGGGFSQSSLQHLSISPWEKLTLLLHLSRAWYMAWLCLQTPGTGCFSREPCAQGSDCATDSIGDDAVCSATPVRDINRSILGFRDSRRTTCTSPALLLNCATGSSVQKQIGADRTEKGCCGRVQDLTEKTPAVIKYLSEIQNPVCWNAEALSFSCRVKEQLTIKIHFMSCPLSRLRFPRA